MLKRAEPSHKAVGTSTAESTSDRDNIRVCPQRAAGVTTLHFMVLPGVLSTTEYKGVVTHAHAHTHTHTHTLLCFGKAIVSFFHLG